jgi:hypothetical protein
MLLAIFQLYHGKQIIFQCNDDEVRFVLDQHAWLEFYSAGSLKQQFADRHVTPIGHIILIPSQPVFALSPYCYFIVFGLTRTGIEPTIYCTRGEHANHYTTDAVRQF